MLSPRALPRYTGVSAVRRNTRRIDKRARSALISAAAVPRATKNAARWRHPSVAYHGAISAVCIGEIDQMGVVGIKATYRDGLKAISSLSLFVVSSVVAIAAGSAA